MTLITLVAVRAYLCLLGPYGDIATAQMLTTLYSFSGSDGSYPEAGLAQGSDGNFYGTTHEGGNTNLNGGRGFGTVFRISPSGSLTNLHSFSRSDGSYLVAGLVQGSDGNFYGTTYEGGNTNLDGGRGFGTVFRISPSGSLTKLYSFSGSDGANPQAGLVQGSDTNFYGTTSAGGASSGGIVFRISPGGSLTNLYSFGYWEGQSPSAGLVQGSDTNFYGTASSGGTSNAGTVFRISPSGSLTKLYSFSGSDGANPMAGLVQGSDTNFYGTTIFGGASNAGTVFRISPSGSLTTLWSFTGGTDGANPQAGLVQGSDGNFYGTTIFGGASTSGTVFRISPSGSLTTLWSFTGGTDGAHPRAGLVQGSDGNFYGTTIFGGASNTGTVFRISGLQNSWTNAAGGKWETGTSWSLGHAPSASDGSDLITNANSKTVTIDATTSGSFPNSLTINNLTVCAPLGATNTLFLNNVGTNMPLRVLGVLTLGTNAAMVVNNSAVLAANSVSIGNSSASSSLVVSNGGSLIVTNGSGTGSVVVNGGSLILGVATFKTDNLVVTNGGVVQHTQTYQVDNGSITVAGGSEQAGSNLVAGSSANSTGIVTVTDAGQLVVTNGVIGIGNSGTLTNGSGVGFMIVSNGTVLANQILLGSSVGGQGQLTIQTNGLVSLVGSNAELVANDLTIDGGDVEIVNGQIYCGESHAGAVSMSDGTANCRIIYVGYNSQGTLTMGAGQMAVSSLLEIGFSAGSAGSVWMSGGQLTATALATTIGNQGVGQMSISNGIVTMADVFVGNSSNPSTLTLAGGTLTVNSLVLLNPSSQFNFTGGWLNALGITNSNGQTLTLGNGVSPVTLNLLGGISSLGNGLEISANATLTGCGTVNGNVTIDSGATVLANCGKLTFAGSLINYGTMRANGGSVLESYGTVVNYGTIDIINGATNFPGTFTNHGTVLDASSVKISQVSKSGPDMLIQIPSVTGHTYQLQYTTSLTPATWTPGASKPGGGVLTFTDTGGAANPQRFYRVQVTAP